MKKIIYGFIGILIGISIYSSLLVSIPKDNSIDVLNNINEEKNIQEDIYYSGRDPIIFNTYHIDNEDIRYFESINLVTYGKNNPMWYWEKVTIPESDDENDNDNSYAPGGILGFDTSIQDLVKVDISPIKTLIAKEGHLPVNKNLFKISSPFGPRKDPFTKTDAFHLGLDISSEFIEGREVYAALSGIVKYASSHNGFGNLIILNHGEFDTLYGHLEAFGEGLKVGDKVEAGDVIGYIGSTGRSTGPHLHFEFDMNGVKVDPQIFIDMINNNTVEIDKNEDKKEEKENENNDEDFDYNTFDGKFKMPKEDDSLKL